MMIFHTTCRFYLKAEVSLKTLSSIITGFFYLNSCSGSVKFVLSLERSWNHVLTFLPIGLTNCGHSIYKQHIISSNSASQCKIILHVHLRYQELEKEQLAIGLSMLFLILLGSQYKVQTAKIFRSSCIKCKTILNFVIYTVPFGSPSINTF